jgi:hypothetical protein
MKTATDRATYRIEYLVFHILSYHLVGSLSLTLNNLCIYDRAQSQPDHVYQSTMLPARRVLMPTSMAFAAVARRGFATSAARFQDPSRPYRDQRTQNFVKIFRRLAVTLGTFLGFGLIYSYAPPMRTSTREGKAFDKYLAS